MGHEIIGEVSKELESNSVKLEDWEMVLEVSVFDVFVDSLTTIERRKVAEDKLSTKDDI